MKWRDPEELHRALESATPDSVKQLFLAYPHACIAGGFVRDAAQTLPYHDIDIFGLTASEIESAGRWLGEPCADTQWAVTHQITVWAANTDDTLLIGEPRFVQLVKNTAHQSANKIVSTFDLACCQCWWDGTSLHTSLCVACGQIGDVSPTSTTFIRMLRLMQRGWRTTTSDLLRAAAMSDIPNTIIDWSLNDPQRVPDSRVAVVPDPVAQQVHF